MSDIKEGSDINVGSIDKDIKRCEQLIKPEHSNWIGISNQLAIAHIVDRVKEVENDLTTVYLKGYADAEEKYKSRIKELEIKQKEMCEEYCPKTERIEELEAKLEFKEYGDLDNTQFEEYMNQFLPKQKIIDEIEALRKMLKATTEGILQEYTVEEIIIKINTLEELLEEKQYAKNYK